MRRHVVLSLLLALGACATGRPFLTGEQITAPLSHHVIGGSVSGGVKWVF